MRVTDHGREYADGRRGGIERNGIAMNEGLAEH